ncbi:hypothetical protein AS156_35460 [Bradyrhizobium macuxiense]|uniref:Uncharacterized protein n=1 Tax=Bradyrhizobium macuxiense TaxID=1755647 RepID=A0A109JZP7_9BRAD|nr:hypothetical protein AS156_35460 [Bradyrhizobium macuxiense]
MNFVGAYRKAIQSTKSKGLTYTEIANNVPKVAQRISTAWFRGLVFDLPMRICEIVILRC